MIIVIQCAAKKRPEAGCLTSRNSTPVLFVANPAIAPTDDRYIYARPDDPSDTGPSWREQLVTYNSDPESNPLGLYPAYKLYMNPAYQRLVDDLGVEKVYILSAGWGLISADFLTPKYDITFSPSVNKEGHKHKLRKRKNTYRDFCLLPDDTDEPILFFGGKHYIPLFCSLTNTIRAEKIIFYNSAKIPDAPECKLEKFETTTRTNWHYECANAFLDGKISTGSAP